MDPQKEMERRQRLAELEDQPRLMNATIAGRAEVNRFYSEVCDDWKLHAQQPRVTPLFSVTLPGDKPQYGS